MKNILSSQTYSVVGYDGLKDFLNSNHVQAS